MKQVKYFTATRMATIAIFAALSGILYLLRIPLSFAFPSWLELNFSDIPALIGTFALGPISGCLIILVKIMIKLIINGTSTAFVGELADLLIGLALVIPAGVIYKKNRSIKGAVIALVASSLCSTALAIFANRFILIPFYAEKMGMATLAGMMTVLFPDCTEQNFYNYYLWISVLPFNLLRCLIASLVTFPIYKRISGVIKRMNDKFDAPAKEGEEGKLTKKTVITIVVSVVVILLLLAAVLIRYFLS